MTNTKTEQPDNPQAYPQIGGDIYDESGMTLRDYFAGQCDIAQYGPARAFFIARGHEATMDELAEYIAEIRFIEADAMLKERMKP